MFSAGYLVICGWVVLRASAESRPRVVGKYLARYFTKMGPLYIKLGQVLATRFDLLDADTIAELRQLHDGCPPSPARHVEEALRRAYGNSRSEIFAEFGTEPIASGSIAQVHRATLKGGEQVAVKIVKQGVRQSLADDLSMAGAIVWFLHWTIPAVRAINLPRHFQEIGTLLATQADLHRERRDQDELRQRFSNHAFIRIPPTYPEISTEDVLVMEFVDAIPGRNWKEVAVPPLVLAQRLQHGVCTMLYLKGIFHADPHPGNIFFTSDGCITLVDFGLVGRITEDDKWGLSSFFYACVHQEWERAAHRLFRYFVDPESASGRPSAELLTELAAVLRNHFGERARQWSTFGFISDSRRALQKHGGGRLTTAFTQAAFMAFTGEGFVKEIAPDLPVWENCRIFADRASPYMSDDLTIQFDKKLWEERERSRSLRIRASKTLIAPTHLDRYVLPSRYPLFIRKAHGSKLEDEDGNTLVDVSCGYGPHILGYGHPVVTNAIATAVCHGAINALAHESEVLLAEDLTGAFPGAALAVFCNSGTEATMQAIRMCRIYRGRTRIAKFEGHFHGWSDQCLVSVHFRFSGPVNHPTPISPCGVPSSIADSTLVLQYGSDESLESLRKNAGELACVICEPMPTALASIDRDFLRRLRSTCDEIGLPLVFDEIVSGFRVAFGGAQTLANVVPDITCLGKIIGGGLPCGAVVGRAELIETVKTSGDPFLDYETKGFVGGTMSGNSVVCAAGHATLSYLRSHPEIYDDLENKTTWLIRSLQETAGEHGVPFFIRGTNSIFAMRFADSAGSRTIREQQQGSHFKANLALAYYMRVHGTYVPELHTMMLSAAHSYEDLQAVNSAFSASLGEMARDGFFVS
jgi:glutamate-1-semialdehyde 2,1-aminomutase